MTYVGVDFGTSSVKAVIVDDEQRVVAAASAPLVVTAPAPGWREQNPADWWTALLEIMGQLKSADPAALSAVRSIGLSGQMHGAVLLDSSGEVLRPCILWNDGRASKECRELEEACPDIQLITGNAVMPGFTAPKLLWVRRHEPEIFRRVARVLLPKAWIRLRLTGEAIEEMSDASGTQWLDVGRRDWSDVVLAATGLSRRTMPRLVEGTDKAGVLRPDLEKEWGIAGPCLLAGGAGDNAAGAIGLGAVRAGDAFVSLGSSGVLWATTSCFKPNPNGGVHAFCHAIPGTWHQMGVTLSAAASLSWWAGIVGKPEAELLGELATIDRPASATFLPYLNGERTPHNDAALCGMFADCSSGAERSDMTQALLEGVAFSIRDCLDALQDAGTKLSRASVIGGGSRSRAWVRILASVLDLPLARLDAGENCGAFGAARLARLADTGEDPLTVCTTWPVLEEILPVPSLRDFYAAKLVRYRELSTAARPTGSKQ